MGGTAARAELTASEAGRCCDEQAFRVLGCLRVYKGAIWGRQIGNLGLEAWGASSDWERVAEAEHADAAGKPQAFLVLKNEVGRLYTWVRGRVRWFNAFGVQQQDTNGQPPRVQTFGSIARKQRGLSTRIFRSVRSGTPAKSSFGTNRWGNQGHESSILGRLRLGDSGAAEYGR